MDSLRPRFRQFLFHLRLLIGAIFIFGYLWWTFRRTISLSFAVKSPVFTNFLEYAIADIARPFVFIGNFLFFGKPKASDFILRLCPTNIDIVSPPCRTKRHTYTIQVMEVIVEYLPMLPIICGYAFLVFSPSHSIISALLIKRLACCKSKLCHSDTPLTYRGTFAYGIYCCLSVFAFFPSLLPSSLPQTPCPDLVQKLISAFRFLLFYFT